MDSYPNANRRPPPEPPNHRNTPLNPCNPPIVAGMNPIRQVDPNFQSFAQVDGHCPHQFSAKANAMNTIVTNASDNTSKTTDTMENTRKDSKPAAVVDERRLDFRIRINLKPLNNEKQPSPAVINIARKHHTFVRRFIEAAGEVTFVTSNDRTQPPPPPFNDIDGFPDNEDAHRRFFRSQIAHTKDGKSILGVK